MKISIIGVGRVGSTLAYNLVSKERFDELVLVGSNKSRVEGEVLDLIHAQQFSGYRRSVIAGDLEDTKDSDIIILAAANKPKGKVESRLKLGQRNVEVFKTIVPNVSKLSPKAVYVVISNPVDILTYATIKLGDLDPKKVVGTGTFIDSVRFRALLSREVRINSFDLRAYILGEHGDSQFPFFSRASAGGELLDVNESRIDMFEKTKEMGYEIYSKKGYTNFAIASATNYIIESIIRNAFYTIPLSLYLEDYHGVSDVCLSVPAVLGRDGIDRIFQIDFEEQELALFKKSAAVVKSAIREIKL